MGQACPTPAPLFLAPFLAENASKNGDLRPKIGHFEAKKRRIRPLLLFSSRRALQSRFLFVDVGEAGSCWMLQTGKPGSDRALQSKRKGGSAYDPVAGKARSPLGWTTHSDDPMAAKAP